MFTTFVVLMGCYILNKVVRFPPPSNAWLISNLYSNSCQDVTEATAEGPSAMEGDVARDAIILSHSASLLMVLHPSLGALYTVMQGLNDAIWRDNCSRQLSWYSCGNVNGQSDWHGRKAYLNAYLIWHFYCLVYSILNILWTEFILVLT